MIRFSAKYLDGIWRSSNCRMYSKDAEIESAKELVEMFRHFMYKGNILGYTVEIVSVTGNGEHIDVIGTEEM